jgi:hypothetical protein
MSTEEQKTASRGFKVEDRRRFGETGEPRVPGEGDESESVTSAPGPDTSTAHAEKASDSTVPEMTFSTFLLSLSTQALAHLGEIANPVTRQLEMDLGSARQVIDILGLLKEKTKGNLDEVEAGLLDGMLYDLRLRYVEVTKNSPRKA